MNLHPPPLIRVVTTLFQNRLGIVGSVLLCLAPLAAPAQSVSFAGAQSVLPFSGLNMPVEVTLDSAGDVFITDNVNNRVLELPRTASGYGPQMTLPVAVSGPTGITVDSAGALFVADDSNSANNDSVVEFPWTPTGYGSQITLPFSGLNQPAGLAVDSAGDLFLSDYGNGLAAELPKTETGYGAQVTLPFTGLGGLDFPYVLRAIAVDSDKNVFLVDDGNDLVLELPWTGVGYGTQVTLPFTGLYFPWGVALDSGGDVFVSDWGNRRVVELPKTSTGYGPQVTLPFSGLYGNYGDAVDNDGDVFVVNYNGNNVLELQTRSVNFGGANVCSPGATTPAPCSQTLTLNYNVNADTTLGTAEVLTGGMGHQDFVRASGSTCTGAVTAGSTCTVNVKFAPLAAGFRNGAVNLTDGSGNFISTTQLSGFGVAATTGPPVAQLSTTYMPFGAIAFGETETLPLAVANIGGGTLTVAPSISGHSYTINTAESTCAAGVTPGTSCTLVVEFSPTSISSTHDDILTVQTNGGNPTVDLHGAAIGLSVSGRQLNFGTVSSGSTEVLPLTVTNVGLPGTVTIATTITVAGESIKGHSFEVLTTSENTCMAGIAAGQSCTLPVEFAPTVSGDHADLLTLTPSAGGGATTVSLAGTTP